MHTACVIASVVLAAYSAWLAHVCMKAARESRQHAAESRDQVALLRAQAEQAQQARRLPEAIRSVALSYAAKAKN